MKHKCKGDPLNSKSLLSKQQLARRRLEKEEITEHYFTDKSLSGNEVIKNTDADENTNTRRPT